MDFVETVAETEDNYAEVLAEAFEYLYNKLSCIKTFDPQANYAYEDDLDVYKTLLWELFICVIAYLRHVKDYAAINVLITYTYFWRITFLVERLSKLITRHSDIIVLL